ncbi:MAG: Lrp/AsnC family transcriptional regulator [Lachnospiraceae bacterium]|nr:Lrp/AsnC family transcriptional regulator [Lachnospiraceae bacterium]
MEQQELRKKLLQIVEKNSRIAIDELAVMLGVPEIDAAGALQSMEEEGIICGYHTMIDWSKTSIEAVSALIEVKVTPQRGMGFDTVAERIYKYPEVQSVYLMSGGFDLMVILEGKSLQEVAGFVSNKLSTMDSILSTATHFILKKYKDHGTILTKKYEDTRERVSP